jgi:hypothetical protein
LIITNDACADNIQSAVFPSFISDHESVLIVKPLKVKSKPPLKITFRDFRNVDWEDLAQSLISTFNEQPFYDPVNIEVKNFISSHIRIFDKLAPIRRKTFRVPNLPTIPSDRTRQLVRFRNNLQRSK